MTPREDGVGGRAPGEASSTGVSSDHYLHAIFNELPGVVWATDAGLRVTQVLGRLLSLGLIDAAQVCSRTLYDIFHTEDPTNVVIANHLKALAGQSAAFLYRLGDRVYDVHVEPRRDAGGESGCVGTAIDVTERETAKRELETSLARLREAQELAHVGSWEWDIATDAVTWSDELYRIYGIELARPRVSYQSFIEGVVKEDAEATKSVLLQALRHPGPFSYQHRVRRPDGEVRMLHCQGDVIVDPGGKPLRMAGSAWDITDTWRATVENQRSFSLLQATLEATADGLLVVDMQGVVVAFNRRFSSMWRIPDELVQRRDDRVLVKFVGEQLQDPGTFMSQVRQVYEELESESFDVLRFKDGRVFERYSRPQRLDGRVVGRVWSFRDVTERERLARRTEFLDDANRLLASLDVERALESVAHLVVPYLGEACAVDLFGPDGPRRVVAVPLGREPLEPVYPRSVYGGHASIYTEGSVAHLSVPLVVDGKVAGALTIASRNRKYAQHELELIQELARRIALAMDNARLYAQAQRALRHRSDFLAIAAHEIRGPLTAIHLAAQSLRAGDLPQEATPQVLNIIEREDRRLARLVDDLLDIGRIEGGMLHFEFRTVDLVALVRDVVSAKGAEFARSGSRCTVTVEEPVLGEWDAMRLEQAVTNLLSNAIKFGRGEPIEVTVQARDGRARVSVTDHGIGIAPDQARHIFEPFERAVSSREYGGLGLGLYIVDMVARGMGGRVTVDSQPGIGSTFTLELPLRRQS